jgi:hypothetical protein
MDRGKHFQQLLTVLLDGFRRHPSKLERSSCARRDCGTCGLECAEPRTTGASTRQRNEKKSNADRQKTRKHSSHSAAGLIIGLISAPNESTVASEEEVHMDEVNVVFGH